jgi:hypothetical protein
VILARHRTDPWPWSLLRHPSIVAWTAPSPASRKVLRPHYVGPARQRLPAVASLTATDTGRSPASRGGAVGVRLYASAPG